MGASFGNNQKGSVNVDLNIVPFIDLMSCLTAFLLVTAVWVSQSALQNDPVGKSASGSKIEPKDQPRLGVLIDDEHITVSSLPSGESRQVAVGDWSGLEGALRAFKTTDDPPPVEVAANSTDAHPIAYSEVMSAMDTAAKVGYSRVGVVDAQQWMR